jgi:hypothetical protein
VLRLFRVRSSFCSPHPPAPITLSLRAHLILLVVASVLPLLAFSLSYQYIDYRATRAAAGQRALEAARGTAADVEREVQIRLSALHVLALSPTLQTGDIAVFRTQAEAVVAHELPGAAIALLAEDGQQVMNTAMPPGTPVPTRNPENIREVFTTGQPRVSDLYQSDVLHRPAIAVDMPVKRPDGRVIDALSLNPSVDAFTEVIRRQHSPEGWLVTVFDRKGHYFGAEPESGSFRRASGVAEFAAAPALGTRGPAGDHLARRDAARDGIYPDRGHRLERGRRRAECSAHGAGVVFGAADRRVGQQPTPARISGGVY